MSLREISVAIAKAYDEAISNNRYLNQEIASRQYPRFEKLPQVRNDEANKLQYKLFKRIGLTYEPVGYTHYYDIMPLWDCKY